MGTPQTDILDLPDAAGAQQTAESTQVDVQPLREKQLQNCLRAALNQPDPLKASLGAVNVDLIACAHELGAAVHESFDDQESKREGCLDAAPALGMLLQVTRQIERLTQLDTQLDRDGRAREHEIQKRGQRGASERG